MRWYVLVTALLGSLSIGSVAEATVLRFDFSVPTSGTPNPVTASITIDNPFNVFITSSFAGVTVNSKNFNVDGAVGFYYNNGGDYLTIGGSLSGVSIVYSATNDFYIDIKNATSATPTVNSVAFAQSGQTGFIALGFPPTGTTLSVTDLTPPAVPLPATLPLLLTALGGLGFAVKRRKSA